MARDYELTNRTGSNSSNEIKASSYVAIQGLSNDQYLLYDAALNGDFTKAWSTPSVAKAFVKKFALRK